MGLKVIVCALILISVDYSFGATEFAGIQKKSNTEGFCEFEGLITERGTIKTFENPCVEHICGDNYNLNINT